jgi:hypothetical protein
MVLVVPLSAGRPKPTSNLQPHTRTGTHFLLAVLPTITIPPWGAGPPNYDHLTGVPWEAES